MGIPARKYQKLAKCLNHYGLNAAYCELRGIGASSVRASSKVDFGYHDIVEGEFYQALKILNERFVPQSTYLLGHSLGGQFACVLLSRHRDMANGIILSASCTVYWRNWKFPGNLSILLFSHFCLLLSKIVGYLPGKKIGFGGREARKLISHWAYNARSGNYRSESVDYDQLMSTLDCPLLAINYDQDRLSPLPATKHLISKLASKQVSFKTLKGEDLGIESANHFTWVRAPKRVAKEVSLWINK